MLEGKKEAHGMSEESRKRWGEEVDRGQTMCSLKDCGKDVGFLLRGMEREVEGLMYWSKNTV